jgi:hypothetical protein
MKRFQWVAASALVAGLFVVPAVAHADDKQPQPAPQNQEQPLHGKVRMTEIGLGQAPQAARTAIEQWAQGAPIKEVNEVRQGTKIQYQAEIERDGRNLKVLVSERGQVLHSGTDLGLDEEMF